MMDIGMGKGGNVPLNAVIALPPKVMVCKNIHV